MLLLLVVVAVVLFTELGPRQSAYSVSCVHRVPRRGWPEGPSRPSQSIFLSYFFKFVISKISLIILSWFDLFGWMFKSNLKFCVCVCYINSTENTSRPSVESQHF